MVVLLSYFYSLGDGVPDEAQRRRQTDRLQMAAPVLHPLSDDRGMGRRPARRTLPSPRRPRSRGPDRILPLIPRRGLRGAIKIFHLCFWCFAGFYVVCFSVPFMRMAEERNFPELWACMGRIIKQFRKLRRRSTYLGADRSFRRAMDILVQRRAHRRDGGVARLRAAYKRRRITSAGNRRLRPGRSQATEDERIAAFAEKYGLSRAR